MNAVGHLAFYAILELLVIFWCTVPYGTFLSSTVMPEWRLTDRLDGWMDDPAGWLAGWLAGRLAGWLTDWLTDWLTLENTDTSYVWCVMSSSQRGQNLCLSTPVRLGPSEPHNSKKISSEVREISKRDTGKKREHGLSHPTFLKSLGFVSLATLAHSRIPEVLSSSSSIYHRISLSLFHPVAPGIVSIPCLDLIDWYIYIHIQKGSAYFSQCSVSIHAYISFTPPLLTPTLIWLHQNLFIEKVSWYVSCDCFHALNLDSKSGQEFFQMNLSLVVAVLSWDVCILSKDCPNAIILLHLKLICIGRHRKEEQTKPSDPIALFWRSLSIVIWLTI